MKEDSLIPTSVRIRPDQYALTKELGIEISSFLREKFDETFSNIESINKLMSETKAHYDKIYSLKEKIERKLEMLNTLSTHELIYLADTKDFLEKHKEGDYLDKLKARKTVWLNIYKPELIDFPVSNQQFLELVNKAYKKMAAT